ncbi:hypothetical protein llap_20771 [Limosa lapponica baueri]|uniref:Uncharacterized protein n=1 Tax=Limosa lapponica baueri TaxID=1758121 RepID=A0A2I0T548_LIMLA|nr:hypothetical protein llap_20771 [Limosa lapponica baueri]
MRGHLQQAEGREERLEAQQDLLREEQSHDGGTGTGTEQRVQGESAQGQQTPARLEGTYTGSAESQLHPGLHQEKCDQQKLFGYEMAEFKVTIKFLWNSETGDFQKLVGDTVEEEEEDDDDDDDSNED